MFTQKDALTVGGERGPVPVTYIGGWAFVGAWAGEGDKFMAPLVHNKTADCIRENKGRMEGRREVERRKRGMGGRDH